MKKIYISNTDVQHVPYEKTITEHRAPTEESVRLLKEFQKEAEGLISDNIRLENNVLKAVGFYIEHGVSIYDYYTMYVYFELNEIKYSISQNIDRRNFINTRFHLTEIVAKKISELIIKEIINQTNNDKI